MTNWELYQSKNVSFLKTLNETQEKTNLETNESQEICGLQGSLETIVETNPKTNHATNTNKGYNNLVTNVTCENSGELSPPKQDRTPYVQIIDLYHELLPKHNTVKKYESLKPQIRARHRDMKDGLESWRRYFNHIREKCTWMTSGDYPSAEKLSYLVRKSNFEDICNGGKNDRG